MGAPLISVIVPVYKVEAYLDRCVQSIVNQTYKNLEIILVDDGSPDNCGPMCDAWAKKDSRIRVIHKENGGLSDARNAGMVIAAGEYIGFVDSDDYIAPEMYQLLLEHMTNDGSDIAACGVEMIWENETPPRRLTQTGSCVLERDAAMEACIRESWLKQPVWYKLYKAELIQDILFPVGKYHEDVFWTWKAVARTEKVSILDTPCYYYVQHGGSIMAEKYSLRRLDAVEAKLERLRYLKKAFPALVERAETDLLFTCMYHGQLALKDLNNHEKNKAFAVLMEVVRVCDAPDVGAFIHKCWLRLAKLNLKFVCKIRNLLGIGF